MVSVFGMHGAVSKARDAEHKHKHESETTADVSLNIRFLLNLLLSDHL